MTKPSCPFCNKSYKKCKKHNSYKKCSCKQSGSGFGKCDKENKLLKEQLKECNDKKHKDHINTTLVSNNKLMNKPYRPLG